MRLLKRFLNGLDRTLIEALNLLRCAELKEFLRSCQSVNPSISDLAITQACHKNSKIWKGFKSDTPALLDGEVSSVRMKEWCKLALELADDLEAEGI